MSFPRFLFGLCALFATLLSATTRLQAQDAQEIIGLVAKVYANTEAYQAQVDSRTIRFVFPAEVSENGEPYTVSRIQYRRSQLKVLRPHGYRLDSHIYYDGGTAGGGGLFSGNPRANMRNRASSWALLVRAENTLAKHGSYVNGQFTVREMPPEEFNKVAGLRLGFPVGADLVLRHFQAAPVPSTDPLPLGLKEPDIIGSEPINGRLAYRIVAKTGTGEPVMLWVEQDTYVIVRTIVQRFGKAAAGATGRRVTVVETFYNNQQLNPSFSSTDFVMGESSIPPQQFTAEQMGFIGVGDLVKLAEVAPVESTGDESLAEDSLDPEPVAETTSGAAEGAAKIDGQALSYEQMAGIVLIEGDGGTATGFMTKIRDVDFVVTNLHVLGGNKTFTLKTLGGEEIKPQGIFGAIGSDIAIIRIQGAQGNLKLAEDVFKSTKIGDKVVVVGNRLGGGVATQTAGSIVGVGPTRVEVSANFEPGNSGSPIVNLSTNEVVGVATYSETRRVQVESSGNTAARSHEATDTTQVVKRWFGYRLDGVTKWQAIDLSRWNEQAERIKKFRETSDALLAVVRFQFDTARQHPRLTSIIERFESRYRTAGTNSVSAAIEIKDLFRVIRTVSDDGVRDLTDGDYYDYYRTCLYWQNSIPAQLEYRQELIKVLKKYENNSRLYLSRMRGGN